MAGGGGGVPNPYYRTKNYRAPEADTDRLRHEYAQAYKDAADTINLISECITSQIQQYSQEWWGVSKDSFLHTWISRFTADASANSTYWNSVLPQSDRSQVPASMQYEYQRDDRGMFQIAMENLNSISGALKQYAQQVDDYRTAKLECYLADAGITLVAIAIGIATLGFGAPESAAADAAAVTAINLTFAGILDALLNILLQVEIGMIVGWVMGTATDYVNQVIFNLQLKHDDFGTATGFQPNSQGTYDINQTELDRAGNQGMLLGGLTGGLGTFGGYLAPLLGSLGKNPLLFNMVNWGVSATFADITAQVITNVQAHQPWQNIDYGQALMDGAFATGITGLTVAGGMAVKQWRFPGTFAVVDPMTGNIEAAGYIGRNGDVTVFGPDGSLITAKGALSIFGPVNSDAGGESGLMPISDGVGSGRSATLDLGQGPLDLTGKWVQLSRSGAVGTFFVTADGLVPGKLQFDTGRNVTVPTPDGELALTDVTRISVNPVTKQVEIGFENGTTDIFTVEDGLFVKADARSDFVEGSVEYGDHTDTAPSWQPHGVTDSSAPALPGLVPDGAGPQRFSEAAPAPSALTGAIIGSVVPTSADSSGIRVSSAVALQPNPFTAPITLSPVVAQPGGSPSIRLASALQGVPAPPPQGGSSAVIPGGGAASQSSGDERSTPPSTPTQPRAASQSSDNVSAPRPSMPPPVPSVVAGVRPLSNVTGEMLRLPSGTELLAGGSDGRADEALRQVPSPPAPLIMTTGPLASDPNRESPPETVTDLMAGGRQHEAVEQMLGPPHGAPPGGGPPEALPSGSPGGGGLRLGDAMAELVRRVDALVEAPAGGHSPLAEPVAELTEARRLLRRALHGYLAAAETEGAPVEVPRWKVERALARLEQALAGLQPSLDALLEAEQRLTDVIGAARRLPAAQQPPELLAAGETLGGLGAVLRPLEQAAGAARQDAVRARADVSTVDLMVPEVPARPVPEPLARPSPADARLRLAEASRAARELLDDRGGATWKDFEDARWTLLRVAPVDSLLRSLEQRRDGRLLGEGLAAVGHRVDELVQAPTGGQSPIAAAEAELRQARSMLRSALAGDHAPDAVARLEQATVAVRLLVREIGELGLEQLVDAARQLRPEHRPPELEGAEERLRALLGHQQRLVNELRAARSELEHARKRDDMQPPATPGMRGLRLGEAMAELIKGMERLVQAPPGGHSPLAEPAAELTRARRDLNRVLAEYFAAAATAGAPVEVPRWKVERALPRLEQALTELLPSVHALWKADRDLTGVVEAAGLLPANQRPPELQEAQETLLSVARILRPLQTAVRSAGQEAARARADVPLIDAMVPDVPVRPLPPPPIRISAADAMVSAEILDALASSKHTGWRAGAVALRVPWPGPGNGMPFAARALSMLLGSDPRVIEAELMRLSDLPIAGKPTGYVLKFLARALVSPRWGLMNSLWAFDYRRGSLLTQVTLDNGATYRVLDARRPRTKFTYTGPNLSQRARVAYDVPALPHPPEGVFPLGRGFALSVGHGMNLAPYIQTGQLQLWVNEGQGSFYHAWKLSGPGPQELGPYRRDGTWREATTGPTSVSFMGGSWTAYGYGVTLTWGPFNLISLSVGTGAWIESETATTASPSSIAEGIYPPFVRREEVAAHPFVGVFLEPLQFTGDIARYLVAALPELYAVGDLIPGFSRLLDLVSAGAGKWLQWDAFHPTFGFTFELDNFKLWRPRPPTAAAPPPAPGPPAPTPARPRLTTSPRPVRSARKPLPPRPSPSARTKPRAMRTVPLHKIGRPAP